MQVLPKTLLAAVAGGEALRDNEMLQRSLAQGVFDGEGGGGGGGEGGPTNDLFAGVGNGPGIGGFDANGVGPNSCVPAAAAPVASGLFGLSLTETLAVATGGAALAGGIGGGIGASAAIEAAGGFSAMGSMGAAATGVGTAMGLGVLAAGATGYLSGTLLYDNSSMVQSATEAVIDYSAKVGDWTMGYEGAGGVTP